MDSLLKEAIQIVIDNNQGSVSLLQRKLSIGWNRAEQIMQTMFKLNIVSDLGNCKPREVLIKNINEVDFSLIN